jgi:hypothetical protein
MKMAAARLSNLDKTQDQLSAEMEITRTRMREFSKNDKSPAGDGSSEITTK